VKFEQRKSQALSEVISFLSNFAPPRGLSDDAMSVHVSGIADAFARRLPVTNAQQFGENLRKTFTTIRDNHKGYAWPVQSEFVDAMPKGNSVAGGKVETFQTDEKEAMARRMNAGNPVPETWVWGSRAWSLVSGGLVGQDTLDDYRRSSVRAFQRAYSQEAYGILQSRFGDVVAPYFAARGAA